MMMSAKARLHQMLVWGWACHDGVSWFTRIIEIMNGLKDADNSRFKI